MKKLYNTAFDEKKSCGAKTVTLEKLYDLLLRYGYFPIWLA